jgi:branched-subunit amino acid ABC-type transport system permease component
VTVLLHSVGFGLVTAAIVALASVAFSLQFSVTTTPNFAHGDFLTVGAYAALVGQHFTNNLPFAVLFAVVAGSACALLLNLGFIQPFLRAGAKRLSIFLVTVSFGLLLQNGILLVAGGEPLSYNLTTPSFQNVGPFQWTYLDEGILVTALIVLVLLHVTLRYTRFGKAMRAVSDNPGLARASGINTPRIVTVTWALDGAIAGYAGCVLAASLGSMTPTMGYGFLVVIFAAAVIGGLGKPYGTLIGALMIGVAMEVSAAYIDSEFKTSIAFALLIIALLVRPRGVISAEIFNLAE